MSTQAILFIHHANDMYGADIGLLHSVTTLDRAKYYPIVILPSDMPTGMLSPELDRLGVEYHFASLGILRRKYLTISNIVPLAVDLLKGIAFVRLTSRKRNVALVYVNTFAPLSGAIGGRIAGVPVLWHIREILAMPRAFRWILTTTLDLCANQVVCISRAVRDSLLADTPALASKSALIYNAVSVAQTGSKDRSAGLREELGMPDGAPLVGTVGRISHWKGQEILIEAARIVLKNHPDTHFVAIGSFFADQSHYLRNLELQIDKLGLEGRFHLADYRSNVTDVYRALDVFVLPSRKPEPFGRVTVEAMMQGCAVIATNHGGTCELIQDGVTGILVPPSDAQTLAATISHLLSNYSLRKKLGQAAAAYAIDNFAMPRYQQQMRQAIDELVVRDSTPKERSVFRNRRSTATPT